MKKTSLFLDKQLHTIFTRGKQQALLIAQLVKNPPAMQETPVQFLGREDSLEKGQDARSSILRLPCLWNSPGQNTRVDSRSLLQGIFPTQGLNPGLPHCRQILYQLSHQGSPRILEQVAYPFSRDSSQPRNQRVKWVLIVKGYSVQHCMRETCQQ